jgi:hypothetical protein
LEVLSKTSYAIYRISLFIRKGVVEQDQVSWSFWGKGTLSVAVLGIELPTFVRSVAMNTRNVAILFCVLPIQAYKYNT